MSESLHPPGARDVRADAAKGVPEHIPAPSQAPSHGPTLVLVAIVLGIYTLLGLEVYKIFFLRPPPDPNRVRLEILASLHRAQDEAEQRHKEKRHLEAALLYTDIAAAYRVLLPELGKPVAVEPDFLELAALQELQSAGVGSVYAEYLKLRYPQWSGEPFVGEGFLRLPDGVGTEPPKTP